MEFNYKYEIYRDPQGRRMMALTTICGRLSNTDHIPLLGQVVSIRYEALPPVVRMNRDGKIFKVRPIRPRVKYTQDVESDPNMEQCPETIIIKPLYTAEFPRATQDDAVKSPQWRYSKPVHCNKPPIVIEPMRNEDITEEVVLGRMVKPIKQEKKASWKYPKSTERRGRSDNPNWRKNNVRPVVKIEKRVKHTDVLIPELVVQRLRHALATSYLNQLSKRQGQQTCKQCKLQFPTLAKFIQHNYQFHTERKYPQLSNE